MDKKSLLLCSLFSIFCVSHTFTQPLLPADENVIQGKLSNGLTYIIRHNEYPANRANFYIAQRVGATLEEDDQNGLAHFLEHMAFNGSKNFPDSRGIINYLETIGVKYGRELNAYTSLDETVYNIDNVPTNHAGAVDSALLILHDWSGCLSLKEDEIDKERGVIREEWRTRDNASRRTYFIHNQNTMHGTRYAIRNIIGDTAIINNFKYNELRNYYKKWYRPDLQGIIIVGDINPQEIIKKMEQIWSDIPTPINPAEREYFVIPDNSEPIVSIAKDPEATSTNFTLRFRKDPASIEARQTYEYIATQMTFDIISAAMRTRFNDIIKKPEAPITSGSCYYAEEVKTKDAFFFSISAKKDKEKEAYTLMIDEAEKLRRFGLTDGEYDRARTNIIKNYENDFNARAKRQTYSYTNEYVNSFLDNDIIISDSIRYEFARTILPQINIDRINKIASYLLTNNVIITVTAPDSVAIPSTDELRNEFINISKKELTSYENKTFDKPLVAETPKQGKLSKKIKNKLFGADEWILNNGIHIYLLPTDYADDEIIMIANSKGGFSLHDAKDVYSAISATDIASQCGLGEYSASDLNKVLTGKTASIYADINTYNESLNGSCRNADFETLLQLTYLKFQTPRDDKDAFNAYIDKLHNSLINASSNPQNVFNDSLYNTITNGNPYYPHLTLDNYKNIDYDRARQIYTERFANPADFFFIFVGDFDKETIKPTILTWLGGLKTNKSQEQYINRNTIISHGLVENRFQRDMQTSKTTNYTIYSALKQYDRISDLSIKILGYLLQMRYDITMREEEGGTYGVGCASELNYYGTNEARLFMSFDTDPKLFEKLSPIIEDEIKKIATNGPDLTDFAKVKENLLKTRTEQLKQNRTWISFLSNKLLFDVDKYNNFENQINSITPDNIKAMAQLFLDSKNRVRVTMEPLNK